MEWVTWVDSGRSGQRGASRSADGWSSSLKGVRWRGICSAGSPLSPLSECVANDATAPRGRAATVLLALFFLVILNSFQDLHFRERVGDSQILKRAGCAGLRRRTTPGRDALEPGRPPGRGSVEQGAAFPEQFLTPDRVETGRRETPHARGEGREADAAAQRSCGRDGPFGIPTRQGLPVAGARPQRPGGGVPSCVMRAGRPGHGQGTNRCPNMKTRRTPFPSRTSGSPSAAIGFPLGSH